MLEMSYVQSFGQDSIESRSNSNDNNNNFWNKLISNAIRPARPDQFVPVTFKLQANITTVVFTPSWS